MIQDQFTHLRHTMSRQQLYQLRQNAKGLCYKCTRPVIPGQNWCEHHAMMSAAKRLETHPPKNASKWRQEVVS
jgi:hypothetical protein